MSGRMPARTAASRRRPRIGGFALTIGSGGPGAISSPAGLRQFLPGDPEGVARRGAGYLEDFCQASGITALFLFGRLARRLQANGHQFPIEGHLVSPVASPSPPSPPRFSPPSPSTQSNAPETPFSDMMDAAAPPNQPPAPPPPPAQQSLPP